MIALVSRIDCNGEKYVLRFNSAFDSVHYAWDQCGRWAADDTTYFTFYDAVTLQSYISYVCFYQFHRCPWCWNKDLHITGRCMSCGSRVLDYPLFSS